MVAILPYFRDLIFPSSYCGSSCGACGLYYRILKSADVKYLKMFKNINWYKSFVVTWHDVRKYDQKNVSYFILVILLQKKTLKRN